MGAALELITTRVTAPGATPADGNVTVNTGNSLQIRAANPNAAVWLVQAWAMNQGDGFLQIRSPLLHDQVRNMRFAVDATRAHPLIPKGFPQRLYPVDTLTVTHSGSAVAGDIENAALLVYYEDLPGAAVKFIDPATLKAQMVNLVTVFFTLASGTSGDYSGEEALTAESDLLKANVRYALLGGMVNVPAAAIRIRGADTGNFGIGFPGDPSLNFMTKDWFVMLSDDLGVPLIPTFDMTNKAGILVDCVVDENGADPVVSLVFAQLK